MQTTGATSGRILSLFDHSTYKLRYYDSPYDPEKKTKIIRGLSEIRERHAIAFEVFPLRVKHTDYGQYVDEDHEKEVYEAQFKPRAKIIKRRIGTSLPRALRSRGGRGHYYLAGVIATVKNDLIEWLTCYESCKQFENYGAEDSALNFLMALTEKGPELMERLCPELGPEEMRTEGKILQDFIGSGTLKGSYELEVRIGSRVHKGEEYTLDYRKSIDAVCHSESEDWVLEVKMDLNYEALGEVLTYSNLYAKQHPDTKVRMGIVCLEKDEEIAETCEKYGVTVFRL